MDVEVEVAGLDSSDGSALFSGFPFSGLTVGESRIGGAFGEGPLVTAIGINQKELHRGAAPAIADRSDLERQGLRDSG
jgi:hypothetical protein